METRTKTRRSRKELPPPPLKEAAGLFALALLALFRVRGRRPPAVPAPGEFYRK